MSTIQHVGIESLGIVTVPVEDVDSALAFYTETLDFEPRMDEAFEMDGHPGRWVTVGVPGQDVDLALVAADAPYYDDERRERMAATLGTETGLTFYTEDCEASVAALAEAGVEITREPVAYEWGTEAMFADPWGNEFSLFEPAEA